MVLLQQLSSTGIAERFQWFYILSVNEFFIRFVIDLISVFILIRFIYYRIYRRTDLFLTFFAFNLIIFLIAFLLNKVQMSIGAAFGLFAVFSMLRYRTEGLSAKDMTYLFMAVSLGMLSAITNGSGHEQVFINGMILLAVWLLESNWLIRQVLTKKVHYDRIDLILPCRRHQLIEDLEVRTGLAIYRAEVQDIDLLKETAQVIIYYYQENSQK